MKLKKSLKKKYTYTRGSFLQRKFLSRVSKIVNKQIQSFQTEIKIVKITNYNFQSYVDAIKITYINITNMI